MLNYNSYRERLLANGGNIVDATKLTTKRSQMKEITASPLRAEVYVNLDESVNYTCIPSIIKNNYEKRSFLFMPDVQINKGDYITHDGFTYLVIEINNSDTHPLATAQLCNSTFPLHTIITETLIGKDTRTNRPVYEEQLQLITVPCIIESRYTQANDTKNFQIPEDRLTISAQYKENNNAELNYEFDAYNDRYRIVDVDLTLVINGVGIIKIIAEKV